MVRDHTLVYYITGLSRLLLLRSLALLLPVADVRLVEHVGGTVLVGPQVASEILHDGRHRPCVTEVTRTPDPLQQVTVGQNLTRVDRRLEE